MGIMKRKRTKITDLSFDVLRHIMVFVSTSSNGAQNLVRTKAVCRVFKELAEDADILKAVLFDNVKLSGIDGSFWQLNGLLCRCILSGNLNALEIVEKYTKILAVDCEIHKGYLLWARMNLAVKIMAVEIVNTRARQRALTMAINDCMRRCDSAEVYLQQAQLFLESLGKALRANHHEIYRVL